MKVVSYVPLFLVTLSAPVFANVTVSSPANGAQVGSPFSLSANAASCSSQSTCDMGYFLANSTDTNIVNGTFVSAAVTSGGGAHTLHVKAWGDAGSVCVTDVAITVEVSAATAEIPSDAISVSNLQTLSNWIAQNDGASVGGSKG